MGKGKLRIEVFATVGLVIAAAAIHLFVNIFVYDNYRVLTTDEEIEEFKADRFGPFADYI